MSGPTPGSIAASLVTLAIGAAVGGYAASSVRAADARASAPTAGESAALVRGAMVAVKDASRERVFQAAPSPLDGFVETYTDGQMTYVSNDGAFLVRGQVFDARTGEDLSRRSANAWRAKTLQQVPAADHLRFGAAHERAQITVFSDPDCPYCRAFHQHVGQLNAAGITVNYLLMPLEIHPDAASKVRAVWCSAGQQKEKLDRAMLGEEVHGPECDTPVSRNLALARLVGVRGTPSVYGPDGDLIDPSLAAKPDELLAKLLP